MNLTVKTDSKDELGTLSNAFNKMTSQLRDLIGSLEGRVAARTKDLATVANISTQTSIIQDPFKMLEAAVHLTQRGFNLYHAHVFTYHEDSNDLQILVCGYREGDVHEGTHGTTSIPVSQEQSLVARAARTRKPVIVNDVRSDPGWLPNPFLPETHAEMAVPMIVGEELLGILDVQADHVDAFTEADANIQMTLASQIATSLKNARSYSESKAQADLESLVNSIGQKIQRATTVEDTLQTAIREIGLALGASRVSVNVQASRQIDDEARRN
jgi:GAF domain-containing protein